MRYALDTEFIDTPEGSALISLAIVREDGASRYFEFTYPEEWLTPWLRENVLPHLAGNHFHSPARAAVEIRDFVGTGRPEFWCYFGAYDWYWFCRLFGGMMNLPPKWPQRYRELADFGTGKPVADGAQHNALADAHGIMAAVRSINDG